MPNWEQMLADFFDKTKNPTIETQWAQTPRPVSVQQNPPFSKIFFPYRTDISFLAAPERQSGSYQNMMWPVLAGVEPKHEAYQYSQAFATVHMMIYSHARSDMKGDIITARDRVSNMRDQVVSLIKANWNSSLFAPSTQATTGPGERDLSDTRASPMYWMRVLPIKFWYEE
jgi:hypothetical protein